MERVKFIVAESSYLIRKGIVSIINRIEHASVIKELDTLEEINSALLKYTPDFLVYNLDLLAHLNTFRNSNIKLDLSAKGIAINTGGSPELLLEKNFREIINLADTKGEIFEKINNLIFEKDKSKIVPEYINELSEREKTILRYVAKGLTNKEIADKLFLSAHTVITHRKNITTKLGIKTISGLTVYAILNNLISLDLK
jgi:two-component system, NarL family, response regulator NreC